jgi:hypothetical protein
MPPRGRPQGAQNYEPENGEERERKEPPKDSAIVYTYFLDKVRDDGVVEAFPGIDIHTIQKTHWDEHVDYSIQQIELCPTTGRRHVQGYIELKRRLRMPNQVKKCLFGDPKSHVHLERRRDTQMAAINYCSKTDTRMEGHGPWVYPPGATPKVSQQGSRSDLSEIVDHVSSAVKTRQGENVLFDLCVGEYRSTVSRNLPWARIVILGEYAKQFQRKMRGPVDVFYLWGPGNTGKSEWVYSMVGPKPYYKLEATMIKEGNSYWEQYDYSPILFLDECLRKMTDDVATLLTFLDPKGPPTTLNVKCTSAYAAWKVVFITHNVSPTIAFSHNNTDAATHWALQRRIKQEVNVMPDHYLVRNRITSRQNGVTFSDWIRYEGSLCTEFVDERTGKVDYVPNFLPDLSEENRIHLPFGHYQHENVFAGDDHDFPHPAAESDAAAFA